MTRPGWRRSALRKALPSDYAERFAYDRKVRGYRGPSGKFIFFTAVTQLDIESTDIRERVKSDRSIRYLVPDAVREYIDRHDLYKR
jgi:nicotinate-nucleotide adenylyltransferase